jgi:hypothetical protein
MQLPTNVPAEKQQLLRQLIEALSTVANVAAVVLGGSYASGTQRETSDLDIGIYYWEATPFAIDQITQVAQRIALPSTTPTVTSFYEWGAWVNGGAWIQTGAGKVDFLYRNLDQVQKVLSDAQRGLRRHDYDQQPTSGFYSVGYLAETLICIPLHDPTGHIARLKEQVVDYPPALKHNTIVDSLWSAEFTLLFAKDYAVKGDVYNTVGCLVRAAADMNQALFALNERYFISDKRVVETIAEFSILPENYGKRLNQILAAAGADSATLSNSVTEIASAWRDIVALAGTVYTPKFAV